MERLLDPNECRDVVFPIVHQDIWKHYKDQTACFWLPSEIDFSKDREQWNTLLNEDERTFLRSILAFFSSADSVVSQNLMNRFCKEVTAIEAQIAYTFQAMMENVHAETYSLMIDTYVTDTSERESMFQRLGDIPTVGEKVEWAKKWGREEGSDVDGSASFAQRLFAYAIVEGVLFQGSFCAIYWLKQRNLLPGLTKSNEFIARDEGMHCEFACMLYNKLENTRLRQEDAHAMLRDAVEIECRFITEAIPCRLIGMNSDLMIQYVKSVADAVIKSMGYDPVYGASNPFSFMELIGMVGRSNFFEERVSHYQRADVNNVSAANVTWDADEPF
jgi:ribonucleotide reductase beta subunit family protein with ferritin-like domain